MSLLPSIARPDAEPIEADQRAAQVLGAHRIDRELAVGHRGEPDEPADLDVVGADRVCAAERPAALDGVAVGADALDLRAHRHQEAGEVLDVGLARSVAQNGRPLAITAAISAFSVPVTLGSSRNMSAPTSFFAFDLVAVAHHDRGAQRSSARKWVSTRRRPMTSPPGGGSVTVPKRASSGPASSIEARIRAQSAGRAAWARPPGRRSARFGPVHSALRAEIVEQGEHVSTSRMRGMFSSSTAPSASSWPPESARRRSCCRRDGWCRAAGDRRGRGIEEAWPNCGRVAIASSGVGGCGGWRPHCFHGCDVAPGLARLFRTVRDA